MLEIQSLMDDRLTGRKDLIAEHGLSMLVICADRRILFDCGSSANMLRNAEKLGVSLKNLDAVVLSHSHYDHAGGFPYLIREGGGSTRLYTGPGFFEPKLSRRECCFACLGAGFDQEFLREHGIEHHTVEGLLELFPGVWLISGFPRKNAMETIPQRFVRRTAEGMIPDDFRDEVCLALDTAEGLVMLVGCAHPGIVNMVSHVHELLGRPVYAVFGGTHLVEADSLRTQWTLDVLQTMGLKLLGLSHCSGEAAACALQERPDVKSCRLGPGDWVSV